MGAVGAPPRHDGGGAGAWVVGRGGLEVIGGVAGTRATLEALVEAASRMEAAAESLRLGAACVERAGDAGGGRGAAALARVAGARGFAGCADRASDVARALRTAAATYEEADRRARAEALSVVAWAAAIGEAGPLAWALLGGSVALVGGWLLQQAFVLRLLRASPGALGVLLRQVPDLSDVAGGWLSTAATADGGLLPDGVGLPDGDAVQTAVLMYATFLLAAQPGRWRAHDRPVEELAGRLSEGFREAGRLLGLPPREVWVAPSLARDVPRTREAPRNVGDLMDLVADLNDAHAPTIALQRLDHPDGTRSWVVAVPGTRSMDLVGGEDPMDMETNLALMAGTDDDMTAAVEAAMLQAGVRPDEPVVLVGHSQGGMVATRFAERWHDTYRVEAVVTAGSPVAGMPVPGGVAALALEHAQDWIPAIDGFDNPDVRNRTTVVRDLPAQLARTPVGTVDTWHTGGAHDVTGYAQTARIVDGMDHPSVRAFRRRLGEVLGDPGTTATTHLFTVARVPGTAAGPADRP